MRLCFDPTKLRSKSTIQCSSIDQNIAILEIRNHNQLLCKIMCINHKYRNNPVFCYFVCLVYGNFESYRSSVIFNDGQGCAVTLCQNIGYILLNKANKREQHLNYRYHCH